MPACAAYGCKNRPEVHRKNGITFHVFPKDEDLRMKWVKAVNRDQFLPSKSALLCSNHFREEDLDRTAVSCVRIREGVVPSVFAPHLRCTKTKSRKVPVPRPVTTVDTAPLAAPQTAPPAAPPVFLDRTLAPGNASPRRELNEEDEQTIASGKTFKLLQQSKPSVARPVLTIDPAPPVPPPVFVFVDNTQAENASLKRKLEEKQKQTIASNKKIKLLQQSNRRLKKKNTKLMNVICELKKQNLLTAKEKTGFIVCPRLDCTM